MASRRDYFYRQLVSEADLDAGFDGLEAADRALMADMGAFGALSLAAVTQHAGTPNLSVDVSAPGVLYDQQGRRILIPSLQNVDVSVDDSSTPTTVSAPGLERWVSVFVKFDRDLSDPEVDGNSNTVYFVRDEGFTISVVQGSEAATGLGVRPALLSDGVLLADVKRINGQTQVLNADISTTRRQNAFAITGSPRSVARGLAKEAISDLLGFYNNHVTGAADKHAAAAVDYAGGSAWRDGATNPAATVEAQLDKVVTDLILQTNASSGADKIGSAGIAGGSSTIPVGTVMSVMTALKSATNLDYAGGATWADGTTNPAAAIETQLDKIITDLSTSVSAGGAARIGAGARTTWLGGRTNPGGTLAAALDKIITDLSAATASDDGAERIGAEATPTAVLAAGSVRSQLNLLAEGAVAFIGAKTFADITASGSGNYKHTSTSVTKSMAHCTIATDAAAANVSRGQGNIIKNATTTAITFDVVLDLPNGQVLTAAGIRVISAGLTFPTGSKPQCWLYRITRATFAETILVGPITDASTNSSQYNTAHDLAATGASETIDNATNMYVLRVNTESGAGAAAGTVYFSPWAVMTCTFHPRGAA